MPLREAVIKLAAEKPELRKHLVPILRTAMEFDTQDALDKYLKEHPDADRSNHSVKKDAPKKEPSGKPAKMPPAQQKALKDTAKELDKSPRELLKVWNTERPHFGGAGPHRYEDGACVYCGRPKEYEPRGQSKTAMEFPTEEALKKYLKEHPDADRSKHHVVKDQGKAKPKDVTTGKGSGFGPHKKGPSVKSPKDVKEGDILLRESGGTQNVFKVTKAGPDFMEGHFVDPHDTKKKRLPSDQNQHVWDFAFGKEYSKAK